MITLLSSLVAHPEKIHGALASASGDQINNLVSVIGKYPQAAPLPVIDQILSHPNTKANIEHDLAIGIIAETVNRSYSTSPTPEEKTRIANVVSVLIAKLLPDMSRLVYCFSHDHANVEPEIKSDLENTLFKILRHATHPSALPAAKHWWSSSPCEMSIKNLVVMDVRFGQDAAQAPFLENQNPHHHFKISGSNFRLGWDTSVRLVEGLCAHQPQSLDRLQETQKDMVDLWFMFKMIVVENACSRHTPDAEAYAQLLPQNPLLETMWPSLTASQKDHFLHAFADRPHLMPPAIRASPSLLNQIVFDALNNNTVFHAAPLALQREFLDPILPRFDHNQDPTAELLRLVVDRRALLTHEQILATAQKSDRTEPLEFMKHGWPKALSWSLNAEHQDLCHKLAAIAPDWAIDQMLMLRAQGLGRASRALPMSEILIRVDALLNSLPPERHSVIWSSVALEYKIFPDFYARHTAKSLTQQTAQQAHAARSQSPRKM